MRFYNTERYHGAIGYVTPEQRHSGTDKEILARREAKKLLARRRRFERNRHPEDEVFTMAKAA